MPDDTPNPYESTQHSLLPRAKLIRGKEWSFSLDGSPHRVVLNHSSMGMQTSFYVDDVLQFKSGGMVSLPRDGDLDIPFAIRSHLLLVTIRPSMFGSYYSLYIDGLLFDGPGTDPKREARQKQTTHLILASIMLVICLWAMVANFGTQKYFGPFRIDLLSGAGILISGNALLSLGLKSLRKQA